MAKNNGQIALKPNPHCKTCWGRGWIRVSNPQNESKEIKPCHCVKAKVDEWPEADATILQGVY